MNKWEDKYSKLKNGQFDARIDELRDKEDNKTATKEEHKEYEKLSKAKNNLGKVENVLEYREKLKEDLEDLKREIETRRDAVLANPSVRGSSPKPLGLVHDGLAKQSLDAIAWYSLG